jgi:hypothetical protein
VVTRSGGAQVRRRGALPEHLNAREHASEWPLIPDLEVTDGNHDGNVGSQRQPGAATGSQALQLAWAELGIRYT